jgi:hypothetical protein
MLTTDTGSVKESGSRVVGYFDRASGEATAAYELARYQRLRFSLTRTVK